MPEFRASLWQRLTFSWVTPLLSRGAKTPLELSDVWDLERSDRNATVVGRLRAQLGREMALDPSQRSLFRALVRCWGPDFATLVPI